jgi:hypothetical protein
MNKATLLSLVASARQRAERGDFDMVEQFLMLYRGWLMGALIVGLVLSWAALGLAISVELSLSRNPPQRISRIDDTSPPPELWLG